jgi:2-desacetyl-2-hydroxyethyl bacteriochlorophyllide A dehydrogenase
VRYLEIDAGQATLREGPEPTPEPGDALVRVLACGICGTDLHLLRGMVLPPGASYPVRPGHEVAGIVEQVPAAGSPVSQGELVVLHPLSSCGECPSCLRGEDQRCPHAGILGIHRAGGLADRVAWPATRMCSATGIAPVAAALLADAAATAYHAIARAQVPRGGSLCVLGAGGVGTSVLAIARALDPAVRLSAVVRSQASAARVSALDVHVLEGLEQAARTLRRQFGRVDAVIDFSGHAAAPAQGAGMLRRGGRLVLGSVVDDPLVLGPSSVFMTQELELAGAYTSSLGDLAAVVELARAGRLPIEEWVSHRRSLDDAVEALELVAKRPPGMVRVVVETDRP